MCPWGFNDQTNHLVQQNDIPGLRQVSEHYEFFVLNYSKKMQFTHQQRYFLSR
ncbi:unnamed protein product (macronuclear) [Paramecium tetraurelia]|uniref:Uncharacterized protein n=1 Tax=Paramecium tetraurelia TaxID=5888 RepID=A0D9Y3_PARTE|nr:uncharacterized protein GSPATT00014782001 [Paramecium tetraurelia]CAK79850.1 unnamed protein product [Paramecium tetraurelia]|eukprot:XP_001447247.1 hypothetical protein (macronuclear) [Paramecium tetraurelia strain d4-2]